MGLANVPWEWDYPMCTGNETSLCALQMGQANCSVNGTIQCALGMRPANVPREWD